MSKLKERLVTRLRDEGENTIQFFQALRPEDWKLEVYTENTSWTIQDILRHFISAESGITRLIANILDGGEGVPEGFDLDQYNEIGVGRLTTKSPEELLEEFAQIRTQTLEIVMNLGEEDLDRAGRHPFLGVAPVVDIIKLMYRHNQIHRRDMRKYLKGIH